MKKFYSLSQYPGKTGEYYYRRMFAIHRLPYTYTALKCIDIQKDLTNLIKKNAAGISVSMPFKQSVIQYLDHCHPDVIQFNSCNTIKIENNKTYGYNTDVYGAKYIIPLFVDIRDNVSILGDGSMATMFKDLIGEGVTLFSRKIGNWGDRHADTDVIINCTSFGTSTRDSPLNFLPKCKLVVDLAIKDTQLELQCFDTGTKYINGMLFYKYQFMHQYKIYTGIGITIDEINNI